MAKSVVNQDKSPMLDLRRRLIVVFIALVVFRIGSYIPVPGVDASVLADFISQQQGSTIDFWNTFGGGALSRASILALGIMPYISASIVMQLLTAFLPSLVELKKQGEHGRRKINKLTRWLTLGLSILQAVMVTSALPTLIQGLVPVYNVTFFISASVSLVVGSMFLMWLGEQITERGIGNGISLIVFAGIISGLPNAIGSTIEQTRTGQLSFISLIVIAIVVIVVIYAIVFVERAQRRIQIHYPTKGQVGLTRNSMPNTSYLPFKINMAGVIPAIFASSIIAFIATSAQWFGGESDIMASIGNLFYPGQPLQMILMGVLIIFFSFFYTSMQYNPNETADQLKQSGAFIHGTRPGKETAKQLDRIMTRITLLGGLYLTAVALTPEFMRLFYNFNFSFGGVSLLIVVVVIMDFISQVQTFLMSNKYHYDSLEKKKKYTLKSKSSRLR